MNNYRTIMSDVLKAWDVPFNESLGRGSVNDYSRLRNMQSPAEFYAAIDKALKENDIEIEEVKRLQVEGTRDQLYELVTPAYAQLIENGYEERDLIT